MTITVNTLRILAKSFSVKTDGAMMNNIKQREEIHKPPPDYVWGKPRLDGREQSAVVAEEQMVDRETSDCSDSREI